MYMTMILLNFFFILFAKKYQKDQEPNVRFYEVALISYMFIFMVWGSTIALVDQRLYGQLMAFVINITSGSVIFYFSNKHILIPYSISSIVLCAGLPFFQSSTEVLVAIISISLFFCFFLG